MQSVGNSVVVARRLQGLQSFRPVRSLCSLLVHWSSFSRSRVTSFSVLMLLIKKGRLEVSSWAPGMIEEGSSFRFSIALRQFI